MATQVQSTAPSFKERLKARRRELEKDETTVMPVPGYEGLYCRYRVLGYEDLKAIGDRVAREDGISQAEGEKATAAETLIDACLDLLERTEDGSYRSLGYRWTPAVANDLFLDEDERLPPEANGRDALYAIFPYPRDMLMMAHFEDYASRSQGDLVESIERRMQGESKGGSAPTSSDSPQPPAWPEFPLTSGEPTQPQTEISSTTWEP